MLATCSFPPQIIPEVNLINNSSHYLTSDPSILLYLSLYFTLSFLGVFPQPYMPQLLKFSEGGMKKTPKQTARVYLNLKRCYIK